MDAPPRHLNRGYIRVFRSVFDDEDDFWKEDRPRTDWEAWLWILRSTHWDTTPGEVTVRGKVVPIHRGEVYLSRRTFAKKMGWTAAKARAYLNLTRKMSRIVPSDRAAYGIHMVINYDAYNPYFGDGAPETRPPMPPAKHPQNNPLPIMNQRAQRTNQASERDGPALTRAAETETPEQRKQAEIDSLTAQLAAASDCGRDTIYSVRRLAFLEGRDRDEAEKEWRAETARAAHKRGAE